MSSASSSSSTNQQSHKAVVKMLGELFCCIGVVNHSDVFSCFNEKFLKFTSLYDSFWVEYYENLSKLKLFNKNFFLNFCKKNWNSLKPCDL